MDFQRQTNRRLYEEHVATIELLGRVERTFTGRAGAYPPAEGDSGWASFARTVIGAIEVEVARHFEFEERELFPRLDEAGDGDLVALLNEEHATIREVAGPLAELLRKSLAGGMQPADWQHEDPGAGAERAPGLACAEGRRVAAGGSGRPARRGHRPRAVRRVRGGVRSAGRRLQPSARASFTTAGSSGSGRSSKSSRDASLSMPSFSRSTLPVMLR